MTTHPEAAMTRERADAKEIAKKLEALGSTLSSRAKQYAGCSWLPDPSRPIADSMPGIWEYRQAALCAEAAAETSAGLQA